MGTSVLRKHACTAMPSEGVGLSLVKGLRVTVTRGGGCMCISECVRVKRDRGDGGVGWGFELGETQRNDQGGFGA